MKKLIRPKKVQKGQRNYVTNEQFQDYAEQNFKNIYNYLEEDVLFDDPENLAETLNLPVNLSAYDSLEIWYRVDRGVDNDTYVIRGSQKLQKPVDSYFNIHVLFRITNTRVVGAVSLYKVNEKSINLISGAGYEFTGGNYPINNTVNSGFITRIVGRKGE